MDQQPQPTPNPIPATVVNPAPTSPQFYGQQPASSQPQRPQPQAYQLAPQPIVINSPGWFSSWFMRLGWAGFFFCGILLIGQWATLHQYFDTTGGIQEKYHSGEKFVQDKIAIIDISGVIMDGDGFVKRQIDRIRDDEHVKAIVLRINSPGGAGKRCRLSLPSPEEAAKRKESSSRR